MFDVIVSEHGFRRLSDCGVLLLVRSRDNFRLLGMASTALEHLQAEAKLMEYLEAFFALIENEAVNLM